MFNPPGKTIVLFNEIVGEGLDEIEILKQVQLVEQSLLSLGYEVKRLALGLDLKSIAGQIQEYNPLFVFNLTETLHNDGQLAWVGASLLDHLRVPYTGCSKEAIFCTSNKIMSKQLFTLFGLPHCEWYTGNSDFSNESFSPGHYILKAVWEHGSFAIEEDSVRMFEKKADLVSAIRQKSGLFKTEFFAEKYVHGRDISVPILAGEILPMRDIIYENYAEDRIRVLGYRSKWVHDSQEYEATTSSYEYTGADEVWLSRLREISQKCWREFNLSGYARIDFRLDGKNAPYLLEVNSNPSICEGNSFYYALEEAKISHEQAVERIIADIAQPFRP